jgi:hypothetical protein
MYTPRPELHKSRNYKKIAALPAVTTQSEISMGIPDLSKVVGLTNTLL